MSAGREITRANVARVCVAAVDDGNASNKVFEIVSSPDSPELPKAEWFA